MYLNTAVAIVFVLASGKLFAPCQAQQIQHRPSGSNAAYVNRLLDEFITQKRNGRSRQRLLFERDFNCHTFDVHQLVRTMKIGGDIQRLIDDIKSRSTNFWQQILDSVQQRFNENYERSVNLQRAIESIIPAAERHDPLVRSFLIDMRSAARKLYIAAGELWTEKRASFLADSTQLLSAVQRMHANAVASYDENDYQLAFAKLLRRSYDLLWDDFSDFFDRYADIFESADERYRVLAVLVVSGDNI